MPLFVWKLSAWRWMGWMASFDFWRDVACLGAEMNDKELLELAAKAAGIEGKYVSGFMPDTYFYQSNTDGIYYIHDNQGYAIWNPLTNDGDALRLAVKLEMWVDTVEYEKGVEVFRAPDIRICQPRGDDPYAATRRAIVRAAAEIGRTK